MAYSPPASERPLVALVGPTASGKSSLAIAIAERFRGEVLNCDSLQMYRWFDIGTAKTLPAERRGIPHHFLDFLNPDEQFAAGEYMRRGREVLAEVSASGHLPIVTGGTGFYLRALLDGLFAAPARNANLRQRLGDKADEKGSPYLHRLLRRIDPQAAASIHPNDRPKLIRALEVCLTAHRPVSQLFAAGRSPLTGYRVLKIGLNPPRELLYDRINHRARAMFEVGLIEEVRAIAARGYSLDLWPFRSHGYRQAVDYIRGRIPLAEAIYHTQTRTRQYAKRQMTWFRKELGVVWFNGFGSDPEIRSRVLELVEREFAAAGTVV